MNDIHLSVIIPVYNAERTLARAFDSILMQKTTYNFEVVVVDDASNDETSSICHEYKDKFKHFVLHKNEVNSGNAYTFYVGLKLSKGKFFCVLDGDDFYTVDYKIQRQISFLLEDTREEYVAVGHYFLYYFDNRKIFISKKDAGGFEYDYHDFLEGNIRYTHTSTMMYRNIYETVPTFFGQDEFRGDTPRTFFALYLTNKKVRILNFVGSVYYQNNNGIWTSMSKKAQLKRTLQFSKKFLKLLASQDERKLYKRNIKKRILYYKNEGNKIPQYSIDDLLHIVRGNMENETKYSHDTRHRRFTHAYYDSLAASIQYMLALGPLSVQHCAEE